MKAITILLVLLIIFCGCGLPAWAQNKDHSYYQSGGLGLVFIILLILLFTGRV